MSDEKKCPRCAETIKAEAKVCRHCGYDFEKGHGPETHVMPSPPDKKSKKGLVGCAVVLGLIILAVLLFGSGGSDDGSVGSADPAKPAEPALKVTARELATAYEANEAAAQQRFGNKPLEVTATVTGVQLDFSDKPFLTLAGANEFTGPQAQLTEASQTKASGLAKGNAVTLICGGVSEVVGTPMLSDCEIQ